VAALVFGPSKLPELGKTAGQTAKSFQDAAREFSEELKKGMEVSLASLTLAELLQTCRMFHVL
jgi:TatA/E family protein of Tat protein translocase